MPTSIFDDEPLLIWIESSKFDSAPDTTSARTNGTSVVPSIRNSLRRASTSATAASLAATWPSSSSTRARSSSFSAWRSPEANAPFQVSPMGLKMPDATSPTGAKNDSTELRADSMRPEPAEVEGEQGDRGQHEEDERESGTARAPADCHDLRDLRWAWTRTARP